MVAINEKTSFQANLNGKVALITGASQGLGAYFAQILAQNGAFVIVSGRSKSEQQLNEVVAKIKAQGLKAASIILDMTDYDSFHNKVLEATKITGSIDILINNAAVSSDKSIFNIFQSDWDMHMNTNLKGLFFLTQAVATQMKTQKAGGSIINIGAINGSKIRKNCISYGTSKAGVIHLTKAMSYELIEYGIRVNALVLGLFASENVKDWLTNDPKSEDYVKKIPAKRAGELSDLEGPILLLASDSSSYMHGTVMQVDGGFSIDVFMNLDITRLPRNLNKGNFNKVS